MSEILGKNEQLSTENGLLRKKILALQKEMEQLEAEQQKASLVPLRLNELLAVKAEQAASLEKDAQELNERIMQIEKENQGLNDKIVEHEQLRKTFEGEQGNLKSQIANLQKKIQESEGGYTKSTRDLEAEKEKLSKMLEESRANQTKAEEAFRVEKQNLIGENTRLKTENETSLVQLATDVENLKTKNKELEDTVANLRLGTGVESKLNEKVVSLEENAKTLQEKVSSNTEKVSKLRRDKAMMEDLLRAKTKIAKQKGMPSKDAAQNDHQVQGYKYAASGQYNKAIEEYQSALEDSPFKKDIYYNLGFIYVKMGNFDEAISNYKQVLELDPSDKEAHYNLYQIYDKLADKKSAEEYYNRYLKLQNQ